jgi:hypothetical protein
MSLLLHSLDATQNLKQHGLSGTNKQKSVPRFNIIVNLVLYLQAGNETDFYSGIFIFDLGKIKTNKSIMNVSVKTVHQNLMVWIVLLCNKSIDHILSVIGSNKLHMIATLVEKVHKLHSSLNCFSGKLWRFLYLFLPYKFNSWKSW